MLGGPRLLGCPALRDPGTRDAVLAGFMHEKICCLDPWFGRPLRRSLTSVTDVLSPDFLQEIGRLARQLRATNMTLEGELSANKASAPSTRKAPGAERLCFLGRSVSVVGSPPRPVADSKSETFSEQERHGLCFVTRDYSGVLA